MGGEEITLMGWGNAFVRKINGSSPITDIELELHLEGDFKKTEKKVTWLSADGHELIPAEVWEFDHLFTKDKLEEDDIIQLERKGFYRVDKPAAAGKPVVLFGIP